MLELLEQDENKINAKDKMISFSSYLIKINEAGRRDIYDGPQRITPILFLI